jgi:cytochrome c-type biogenesis protein CcmH
MTLLWLCFVLIAGVAVVSLVLPVVRLSRRHYLDSQGDRNQLNIALFRERSAELDQELAQGSIDAAQFALLQGELQQSLLGDVSAAEPPRKRFNLSAGVLMGLVVMALPLSAWWLYDRLGSAQLLGDALWLADTQKEIESAGNMSEMLERLSRRVQDNPDNIDGVILLGRSYMALQRYQEAADAFMRVATLVEGRNENPAPAYGLMAQAPVFQAGLHDPRSQAGCGHGFTL